MGRAGVAVLVRKEIAPLMGADTRRTVAQRLRVALRALDRAGASASVLLTDDEEIRRLNRAFRKLDRATDVLSFPMQGLAGEADPAGAAVFLGDIAISVQTARRRAGPARLPKELERLAVHGLCHLFGHDHHRPGPARRMRALERRLLRTDGRYLPAVPRRRSSTLAGRLPK